MVSTIPLIKQKMLEDMDKALQDEIQIQREDRKSKHQAVDGKLISEPSGHYLYQFTLASPWDPEEGALLQVEVNGFSTIKCSVVSTNGITITIETEEHLPREALAKILLINDSTQLLEQLREVLKNTNEGQASLGSKSLLPKLFSFKRGTRSPSHGFGKFVPDTSQKKAMQMALGSEVSYIIGPPGTGKTSTLAAIAFTHLLEGHTVLITAHTNIAIDNAIMRLADICRDTRNTKELTEGKILRYGTPQLKELREGNKYADVNISQVACRRASNLQEQKSVIEVKLKPLLTQLEVIVELQMQTKAQWQATYRQHVQQRNECQRQLTLLEEKDQLRIMSLQAQLQTVNTQITQIQHSNNFTNQELTGLTSQKATLLYERNSHSTQADTLQSQLIVAQQMSGIKKFFKRIDDNKIAQNLSEINYQLTIADKALIDIQNRIDTLYSLRVIYEQQLDQLFTSRQSIEIQMTLSPAIATLQTTIAQCTQVISFGPDGPQQNNKSVEQTHVQLTREIEQLQAQIGTIDEQMRDLEEKILAEARVVATTLSKTYMDSRIKDRRFDVVIIDEVSMAPLPAVYVVASHADHSVVALGDPYQLSPIVQAKTAAAKEWLGKGLFARNGITFDTARSGYGNSAVLQEQSRMHPGISTIARKHVYKGGIIDSPRVIEQNIFHIEPLLSPDKPLLLCDTSDANPIATIQDKSRINTYHALCSIALARKTLVSLHQSTTSSQSDKERVGIVTPYRKQADLLRRLIKDARLDKLVRAGTIHKFQGLEFEVVIFDTVESPYLPIRYMAGIHESEAMRLVNVAVTRAKQKLIIVANTQYIYEKLKDDDHILYLAIQEAQKAGVEQSYRIFSELSPSVTRNIYGIHNQTVGTLSYELMSLSAAGFQHSTSTNDAKSGELLGTTDDKIAYIAMGTALAHAKSVLRVESPGLVQELTKMKKDNSKRETYTSQQQNNLRYTEQPIRLASSILPLISPCKKCGGTMVPQVRGTDDHGQPFYGCENFRRTGCKNKEDVTEIHLIHIPELSSKPCRGCGKPMRIVNVPFDELKFECAASTSCGFAQRIEFYKG